MRRILVTGAKGFIGTAVCAELANRDAVAVHFDYPHDVRERRAFRDYEDVDGVINLAGVLGTSETIGEEHEAAEVNILGALNVFDAFKGVPIVQIATGHEGQPNPYAVTKTCATQLAVCRARWTGQKISVVRAYHVYGPGQKMCAPHGVSKVRKIVPSFVARALTGMPIEINGDGEQVVDLVYLDDCAKVLVDALEGPYGEITEAGTGRATTVNEAAVDVIGRVPGTNSRVTYVPMRKGEPEGAIVVALDPKCPNPWPYKLSDTIDWYRKKLELARAA